jgi:hypothetical protein
VLIHSHHCELMKLVRVMAVNHCHSWWRWQFDTFRGPATRLWLMTALIVKITSSAMRGRWNWVPEGETEWYHCLSETLNPLLLDQSFQIISNCSVKLLLFWHLSNCMSWLSSLRSFTLKPSVGNLNMVVNTLLFRSYKKDNSWAFPSSKPSKENHYLELTSKWMEILSIMILLEIMNDYVI